MEWLAPVALGVILSALGWLIIDKLTRIENKLDVIQKGQSDQALGLARLEARVLVLEQRNLQ